ncbi:MAG TPA: 6-aminohexanoate hydrolase, partial [Rhodospirillaceae bacterium]|nr:6-aminohexanoate hydrolase [Rhodospirillaceae bacterium]
MPSVPPSMPSQRPHTARELGIMQGFPPRPEKRPTASNWDLPPFNRWSFQNVRALLPTVDVDRGTGPVWDLPSAHQDVSGVKFSALDGTTKTIKQMLTETYTDGFLVMHRGQVITEQYFNDMHPRSLHLAQSVSKSLVGTLAGVLHGEGKLDMDAPLADRIPELAYCGYGDATLGQVLDMQTGVRFVEDYGLPDS